MPDTPLNPMNPPELGKAVRGKRRELGLTLDQVSARSGISKSMLSQVERGLVNPTFSVVWSLTQSLGLDLSALVADGATDRKRVVTHIPAYSAPEKRSADGRCTLRLLSPQRTVLPLEWYDLQLERDGELISPPHAMGTYEHLSCLEGGLRLELEAQQVDVRVGDTVRYYADQAHTIRNTADVPARALLMIALPQQYEGSA